MLLTKKTVKKYQDKIKINLEEIEEGEKQLEKIKKEEIEQELKQDLEDNIIIEEAVEAITKISDINPNFSISVINKLEPYHVPEYSFVLYFKDFLQFNSDIFLKEGTIEDEDKNKHLISIIKNKDIKEKIILNTFAISKFKDIKSTQIVYYFLEVFKNENRLFYRFIQEHKTYLKKTSDNEYPERFTVYFFDLQVLNEDLFNKEFNTNDIIKNIKESKTDYSQEELKEMIRTNKLPKYRMSSIQLAFPASYKFPPDMFPGERSFHRIKKLNFQEIKA